MIIGITGTDGSGKGTVVEYLVNEKGYTHFSGRSFITVEIEKRGLPVDRNHMRIVANDLRRIHGNDYLAAEALQKAKGDGIEDVIVESIRALAEAQTLKKAGALLLAVDADQQVRYERVQGRRSETDKVSFEEFQKHEQLEMDDPDPNGMQKRAVMEMADYTIMNNGSLKKLHEEVEKFLKTVGD